MVGCSDNQKHKAHTTKQQMFDPSQGPLSVPPFFLTTSTLSYPIQVIMTKDIFKNGDGILQTERHNFLSKASKIQSNNSMPAFHNM